MAGGRTSERSEGVSLGRSRDQLERVDVAGSHDAEVPRVKVALAVAPEAIGQNE